MLYLISTANLKPGTREACLAPACIVIEASRKEPGCISYDLHFSVTDPDKMVFVEVWKDRAALDEHFTTPHFKAWRAAIAGHVVSRKLDLITPDKVEGL
jgi:quinol monooxygenase YgiN